MSDPKQPEALRLADWCEMADKRYCMPKLHWCADELRRQHTEIEALRAQVEELRKDAERYRWLRWQQNLHGDCKFEVVETTFWRGDGDCDPTFFACGEELDAAIDAAIAAQENGQ